MVYNMAAHRSPFDAFLIEKNLLVNPGEFDYKKHHAQQSLAIFADTAVPFGLRPANWHDEASPYFDS
jgi:hypothetical protein